MHEWQSRSHVRWECKYHVIIRPKYRQKVCFGKMRRQVGAILRDLCRQRKLELLEGHARLDHIHMVLSIPPKYGVANTLGFLKGKSAVRVHRELMKVRRVTNLHFCRSGIVRARSGWMKRRSAGTCEIRSSATVASTNRSCSNNPNSPNGAFPTFRPLPRGLPKATPSERGSLLE